MQKERGWKTSLTIFFIVTSLAFGVGWSLNKMLLVTGVLS
jgi:ferrous iron transport protein B